MKLVIDWGNSRVKVGLFNNTNFMVKEFNFSHEEAESEITNALENEEIDGGIICTVANTPNTLLNQLTERPNFIIFNHKTPTPIINAYQSAETLGMDRLAAVIATHYLNPNTNNLVISIGTAVVYNYLSQNNTFRGGAISPGIKMRLRAMHEFAHQLPLVVQDNTYPPLIGFDTHSSLLSGAINGVLHEIEGTINAYREQFKELTVTITGGDSSLFAMKIKNKIFADPFLVLKGLNLIYEYNKQ